MFSKFVRNSLVTGVLVVFAAVFALSVSADRLPGEITVEGMVISVSADRLVVGSETFDVRGIRLPQSIGAGSFVEVYVMPSGGAWIVRQVELYTSSSMNRNEFEITGEIEAINGSLITVGGRVYDTRSVRVIGPIAVGAVIELEFTSRTSSAGAVTWALSYLELVVEYDDYDRRDSDRRDSDPRDSDRRDSDRRDSDRRDRDSRDSDPHDHDCDHDDL